MAQPQKRAEARKDPEPDFGSGDFSDAFRVKNADPTKKYLWVYTGIKANGPGVDYYDRIEGWDVEMLSEVGPRPAGTRIRPSDVGKEIVVLDHVLMSIDKKTWEARRAKGQAKADVLDRKIIRRRGQVDRMRGIGNLHGEQFSNDRYTRFDAEIDPLVPVIGES
jgi:hypothetical protein